MQKYKFIFPVIGLLILYSCGKKATEAEVGARVPIAAEVPEPNQSYDYKWDITEQPDASLLQISNLMVPDHPERIVFVPDAPGDYTVQVTISQYGDQVSVQSWDYKVTGEPIPISELSLPGSVDSSKDEAWLNEKVEDSSAVPEMGAAVTPPPPAPIKKAPPKKPAPKRVRKPAPPPPGSSIPADKSHFTIQVAAKKLRSNADDIASRFLNEGLDVYVQKAYIKETDEVWYRIRLGKFDNLEQAHEAAKQFADKYNMTTWVDYVRLDSK